LKKTTPDVYDLQSAQFPYLAGFALKLLVKAMESPAKALLLPKLLRDAGITQFRELNISEVPTFYPFHNISQELKETPPVTLAELEKVAMCATPDKVLPSVSDYAKAYRNNSATPLQVAEQVIKAIEHSNNAAPPLRAIISSLTDDVMKQAEESSKRLANGNPRSVLEGVPVAVKDEMDLQGYPTKAGTIFFSNEPAAADATIVARLREAGAILIGKANMHEIGMGVTGFNKHYGVARNPYHTAHHTGGSSSGSAAAVASGICPIAVSADGGGSIRIPAAFCGMVGLKATFARMSDYGVAPLAWSVAHYGAIANCATDAALAYAIMAGPDAKDPLSMNQPPIELKDWAKKDLKNIKIGIYRQWFEHAEPETVEICEKMLGHLVDAGAIIKEIEIPDLEAARVALSVIISSEMASSQEKYYNSHRHEYGLETRLKLAIARSFTARDYVQAQRVRTRIIQHFATLFEQVDLLVTPATALAAPAISPASLGEGDSDLNLLVEIMRFASPANLTGLPAISIPAGYTKNGLPVGMQVMSGAWQEALLLRTGLIAERCIEKQRPAICYSPLDAAIPK